MLGEPEYNMNELFAQLGLDSSDEAINQFIEKNKLAKDDAMFLNFLPISFCVVVFESPIYFWTSRKKITSKKF